MPLPITDNPSQDYSRLYQNQGDAYNFLSTIRCVEPKKSNTGDLDFGEFLRVDNNNFGSFNML
jgi:hypothetical protein